MGKIQKQVLIWSIIIIGILGVVLGFFLWKEGKQNDTEVMHPGEVTAEQESEEVKPSEGVHESVDVGETANMQEPVEAGETADMQEFEEAEPVTLFVTGDVLLANGVRTNYDASGLSGVLSEFLMEKMQSADVAIINQEFPFSDGGSPMPDKQYTFRIDPAYVQILLDMGVDVASLANNHALDYGKEALLDTFTVLDDAGIAYLGAGETKERCAQPAYMECKGMTVGVLAASRVIPVVGWNIENDQPGMLCTYDSAELLAAIKDTKPNCDYLAVYVHWGLEHHNYPEEYQRQLAQAYIDAGADLVIGSHPHVPQGIEYYKGKPIIYSLGNFVFNPSSEATYAVEVTIEPDHSSNLTVIPVVASGSKTSEMTGQTGADMLQFIQNISYDVTVDETGVVKSVP